MHFQSYAIPLADVKTLTEGMSGVPKRIQLLRVGQFSSDQYGAFDITAEQLAKMKENFDNKVRGYDDGKLPIDYFHENDKVAAGWIEGVELFENNTELWAFVSWTPKGEKAIADRELRYVSAEFNFDYKGNEGEQSFGPTLFGAGLTNRPFIKGMEPVVSLQEGEAKQMTLEQALSKIEELEKKLAAKKLEDGDEMDKMKKELSELRQKDIKLAEEKKANEKKAVFDKMLSEGKACEAQRDAYMGGDMVKFAEAAQPVKLSKQGEEDAEQSEDGVKSDTPAQDKVLELAEKAVKEDKTLSLRESIANILKAKPDLAAKYQKETGR